MMREQTAGPEGRRAVGSVTEGTGLGRLLPPAGGGQRVTFMELFFDLVYVVAVTQLSQLLLAQLGADGSSLLRHRGHPRGTLSALVPRGLL
jgi:Bacterial low temperature requirement A protein (LtrA)